ncbi:MAG: hypothetical protein KDI50_00305 [Candidatus Competibacteraceae bacterium]|nr:hypothetical protein [Candidatus Competibacteraceae bacterium]
MLILNKYGIIEGVFVGDDDGRQRAKVTTKFTTKILNMNERPRSKLRGIKSEMVRSKLRGIRPVKELKFYHINSMRRE